MAVIPRSAAEGVHLELTAEWNGLPLLVNVASIIAIVPLGTAEAAGATTRIVTAESGRWGIEVRESSDAVRDLLVGAWTAVRPPNA